MGSAALRRLRKEAHRPMEPIVGYTCLLSQVADVARVDKVYLLQWSPLVSPSAVNRCSTIRALCDAATKFAGANLDAHGSLAFFNLERWDGSFGDPQSRLEPQSWLLLLLAASGFLTDEAMEKQPTANSKELFPTGSELKKKRKLKFELSDFSFPLAKHKCVNPLFSSVHKSPTADSLEYEENSYGEISDTEIRDAQEEPDSHGDSNSYLEVYDTNVGSHLKGTSTESYGPTMILDRPSTSRGSSSNAITNTLNSFQSANTGEVTMREQEEDNCQLDQGYSEPHLEFEANNDHIIHAKNGTEHSDEEIEDPMLYSNCPLPNAFSVSSGLWSTRQDARLGARKPMIDQEFEQYFSVLML